MLAANDSSRTSLQQPNSSQSSFYNNGNTTSGIMCPLNQETRPLQAPRKEVIATQRASLLFLNLSCDLHAFLFPKETHLSSVVSERQLFQHEDDTRFAHIGFFLFLSIHPRGWDRQTEVVSCTLKVVLNDSFILDCDIVCMLDDIGGVFD